MRLIETKCPNCKANLTVDMDNKTATCEYCGATLLIDDDTVHIQYDNAEEAGYQFKGTPARTGRSGADRTHCRGSKKKRRTWLWVLGWLFIFPVPLTILLLRNKTMKSWLKYGIIAVAWIAYLLIGIAGGASGEETADPVSAGVTFTDSTGTEIVVEDPQRVASLVGSLTDVWCLAGGQDSLVAASDNSFTDFDLDLSSDVVNTGSLMEPDLESLLSADPDLVIASGSLSSQLELKDTLEDAGIKVAYFDVTTFEDYLDLLKIFTDITGKSENYKKYGTEVKTVVDDCVAKAKDDSKEKGYTALVLRAGGRSGVIVKNSEDIVLGAMLNDLEVTNIADSDTALLEELSMEEILRQDPDFIFVVYQGDQESADEAMAKELTSDPAWSSLSAVKNGRYYVMDPEMYHEKPNERWGEAYQKLLELIYGKEDE